MFKAMGHSKVWVLEGGFPKWQQEGRPVEATDADASADQFAYKLDPNMIKTL